jgi:serine/threonine protein kinase
MGLNLLRLFQSTNPDKPLGGRYKIVSELGAGGFGQTFLAEDLHLPGRPQCVVKQLKPQTTDPKALETARRLFDIEAQVLYQLGNHDQIPRLLAHFEDNQEFYLAQELVEGEPLTRELVTGEPWPEERVIALLQDLLQVLAFVHEQQVIHRDIKPSNLMRRRRDGRIVLIDFGAVKQVSTQGVNPKMGHTKTISIGTQGYTPKEQLGGNPRFSSDVYAVGIIGIQALTGLHPRRLSEDPQTGEIKWGAYALQTSRELMMILDRMIRYDFRDRYPTAVEALKAIQSLSTGSAESEPSTQDWSGATALLPNQELQPPPPTSEPTGAATDDLSTNIWVPTNPPVQPQPTASSTSSGDELSTKPRVPTQSPVQPQPTPSSTNLVEPLLHSQASQQSGSSLPTVIAPGLVPRQSAMLWTALAISVAVGTTFFIAKTGLSPQLASRTAERSQELTESPVLGSDRKSALPSPSSLPTESPSTSPTKKITSPTPGSLSTATLASPTPTPSQTKTSPAPTPASSAVKPPPTSVPIASKPASAPVSSGSTSAPSRQEPPVTELLSQADRLREAGQYQKAADLYNQALARKSDAKAYWGLCYSLNSLQQPGEAIAACNKALDLNPNYAEALWSKGNALDQQQRSSDALPLYERATAVKPDFAEAWNNQGVALLGIGRASEAVAAFNKATALKPNFADAWANQGAALWQLGRFRQAIASMDKALQIQPDNPTAKNLRQQAREKLGR